MEDLIVLEREQVVYQKEQNEKFETMTCNVLEQERNEHREER